MSRLKSKQILDLLSTCIPFTNAGYDANLNNRNVTNIATLGVNTSVTTPLIIGGTATTSSITYKTTTGVGTTGADHIFLVGNNGGTEALRILNNGFVGIGTSTPTSPLTIQTASNSSTGGIRVLGYTYPSDISYWSENELVIKYSGINKVVLSANSNSYFNGGNVGINTSTPSYLLDVNGSFHTTGQNTLGDLAGVGSRMVIASATGLLSTQAIPLGTVTSVGLTMPSAFTVTNSPVTSSGSLTVTGAGTTSQYIDGTGALQTFPSLTGYVPYTGATSDVNLGTHKITADAVAFSLTPTNSPGQGQIAYMGTTGALAYIMDNTSVVCHIGQQLYAYVTNDESVTITKGQAVYLYSASGNKASVKLASNTSDATSAKTFGLAAENIASNQKGFIICQGVLDGLNTNGYTAGDTLYLGTTAGSYTNIKPYAPNHMVYIGVVEKANAGNGQIYVKVQNGYELDEIHDVDLITTPPVNNDILTYVTGTNNLWKPKSIAGILGYTPQAAITLTTTGTSGAASFIGATLNIPQYQGAINLTTTGSSGSATLVGTTLNIPTYTLSGLGGVPDSRTLTINGTAYDLTADRTWSVGTVTSVAALTLGTTGTDLSSTVATGTTTPVITLNVPTASATNRGALSSTDWSTFNGKQNAISLTTTGTSGAATLVGATLNIPQYQAALTNPVTGTGTTNYVAKFTGTSTIGNSAIYESGGNVGINNASPSYALDVNGGANLTIRVNSTGYSGIQCDQAGSWAVYMGTEPGSNYARYNSSGSQHTFYNASSPVMTIYTNNNVGINNTSPSAKLSINGSGSTSATTSLSIVDSATTSIFRVRDDGQIAIGSTFQNGILSVNNATESKSNIYSNTVVTNAATSIDFNYFNTDVTPNADISVFTSINGTLRYKGTQNNTSTTQGPISIYAVGLNSSTGTLTNFTGFFTDIRNTSTGTITNMNANWVRTAINSGGGTVTNFYGYRVNAQTIGSTLNVAYEGAIASGTGRYNLYMDGTAQNYLRGNLGINNTTPSALLHLAAGTATASTAPLKLTSGTNLTTAETGAVEYNGTNLFFTRTGTTRENIVTASAVNTVSPTSPNRTITVNINGTTYYIAAKTTND